MTFDLDHTFCSDHVHVLYTAYGGEGGDERILKQPVGSTSRELWRSIGALALLDWCELHVVSSSVNHMTN